MFKFEVPENDQSVYEITTESGNRYLIRCPGERSYETDDTLRDALFAFRVINGNEQLVQLRNLDLIVSVFGGRIFRSGSFVHAAWAICFWFTRERAPTDFATSS